MTTTVLIHTGRGRTLRLRAAPSREALHAMRAGTYGLWQGVEVIGYLGIADRLGYRTGAGDPAEQTARRLWSTKAPWFPGPVFTIPVDGRNVQLFDWPAVREAAIQVGALAPDGVTPQRRRGRRGKARTT